MKQSTLVTLTWFVFLGAGIVFLGIAGWTGSSQYRFIQQASHVQGQVTELVRVDNDNGISWAPLVRFTMPDSAVHHFQSRRSSNPARYDVGETVTVLYEPDQPFTAQLDGTMELWFIPILFGGFGILLTGIGGYFLYDKFRDKRLTAWLRRHGQPVQATSPTVEKNTRLTVNGQHPWQIKAQWHNPTDDTVYTFVSDDLWFDPSDYVVKQQSITVYIDPVNPKRYWMDTSFLPNHN